MGDRDVVSEHGREILEALESVRAERQRQAARPDLAQRVMAVKSFQHARFAGTYSDLLRDARYAAASRFFLEELYGPHDFTERDAQFARIVPALVRLFPGEIVGTVAVLARLHALSESLDGAMGDELLVAPAGGALEASAYQAAWLAVGRPDDRARQIDWLLVVGQSLDRLTRRPLLRHTLRLMRGPAQAAGLSALQRFLEAGFDTFAEMRGAAQFLDCVAARERAVSKALFSGVAARDGLLGFGTSAPA
jgi:hypothetical protein